jgi:glycosyltransferase involved in cell wall biosynthesis
MRVGFDGRAFQPGYKGHFGRGIGLYATELVRALARLGGIELVVYLDPARPVDDTRIPDGAARAWYPRAPLAVPQHDHAVTQLLVPPALAGARYDVFHFPAMQDAPLLLPRRCVVTVHDVILFHMQHLYAPGRPAPYRLARALERATVRRAPRVLTDSETSRADIVRWLGIDEARVRVAPLGVAPRFRPCPPDASGPVLARLGLTRPFVLYLGGIDARKNVPRLLEAYAALRARRADTPDLVLAGRVEREAGYDALMARARALALGDALRLPGYVPDEDLPALLSAARAFVFPSLYEGFGLPVLEAMASGTPVVAAAEPALREVADGAAVYAEDGDFGAATRRALEDRDRLAAAGIERARLFSWPETARRTVEIYRRVLA